jgi:uncharacterized protein (DUF1697 family)
VDIADESNLWQTDELEVRRATATHLPVDVDTLTALLDAAEERDRLRAENARLSAPVVENEINAALDQWLNENDCAPPTAVMGSILGGFVRRRAGGERHG